MVITDKRTINYSVLKIGSYYQIRQLVDRKFEV